MPLIKEKHSKERKLKRAKRREDRRKYGHNKKRRAENKAEAATKRKALAQAAIVGGDAKAGYSKKDSGNYTFDGGETMTVDKAGNSDDGASFGKNKEKRAEKKAARKEKKASKKEGKQRERAEKRGKITNKAKEVASKAKSKASAGKAKVGKIGSKIKEVASKAKAAAASGGSNPAADMSSSAEGPSMHNQGYGYRGRKYDNVPNMSVPARKLQNIQHGSSMYNKKHHGSSMNASQDKSASMDDYSHEKKLKADGRYEAAHGKMANAKNDFDHAHALKKDAHDDARGRASILKHMRKF
tara:strand:- start:34 stop:927 length:894 start_codon:yes stop_codon:yes gene_type:complete